MPKNSRGQAGYHLLLEVAGSLFVMLGALLFGAMVLLTVYFMDK